MLAVLNRGTSVGLCAKNFLIYEDSPNTMLELSIVYS